MNRVKLKLISFKSTLESWQNLRRRFLSPKNRKFIDKIH